MECNEAQDQLGEFIDKRLDPRATTAFEEHISFCLNCRVQLDRMNRTNQVFASMPRIEVPFGFESRVMAHINEEAAKPTFWAWFMLPFRIGVPIQVTAVVLISVLAVFIYQKEQPLERPAPVGKVERSAESKSAAPSTTQSAPANSPSAPALTGQGSDISQGSERQPGGSPQPQPRGARPFGLTGPNVGGGGEYARVGGELTVEYRIVVHLQASAVEERARAGGSRPQFLALSEIQSKSLEQARQRAIESGQAQNETFNLLRESYEQFKKELASMGAVESASTRDARQKDSVAKQSDPVLVLVTLLPPTMPAGVVPAQPGTR